MPFSPEERIAGFQRVIKKLQGARRAAVRTNDVQGVREVDALIAEWEKEISKTRGTKHDEQHS